MIFVYLQNIELNGPPMNSSIYSLMDCGVEKNSNGAIWNRETVSMIIANKVFNNNFKICIDIRFQELDDHWKTYSSLTEADDCIRLRPASRS